MAGQYDRHCQQRIWKAILVCILALQLGLSSSSGSSSSSGYSRRNQLFLSTHSNFLRSNYHHGGRTPGEVRCQNNATVCSDPVRNPKGGVCCFNSVCKQIENDESNCGGCNKVCGYGFTCCQGSCVNLMTDSYHCGGCNIRCHDSVSCELGLCGYAGDGDGDGGGADETLVEHKVKFPKQW